MSGHSKWSTIKHKKAITDKKRSQLFSKYSKLISIAAREGTNPETNLQLKGAIDKARSVNMPKDNIERAIKRASKEGVALSNIQIEALGPEQVAIIIEAITDNTNRTVSEIRTLLNNYSFKMAQPGAVAWMFEKTGVIKITSDLEPTLRDFDLEEVELNIIEAGAEDIKKEGDTIFVYTKPEKLVEIKSAITNMKIPVESAEMDMIAKTTVILGEEKIKSKLNQLFEALDDQEEVQEIYSNLAQ